MRLPRMTITCNWIAGECFARQQANVFEVRKFAYHEVRAKFDLSSQMAQLAIKFVLGHVAVSVTIPGAKNHTQLEQNFGASPLPPLTRNELAVIEQTLSGGCHPAGRSRTRWSGSGYLGGIALG